MNYRNLLFAITLMGICLCSCKQYAVARLGIKEPQVETPESIRQYLLTHDFPTENQYIVKDTSSYYFMIKNLPSQGLIGTLIFDKDLHLITRDTSKCQWSFGEAVSGLSKGQNYQLSENINGSEVLGFLVPLDSTTVFPTINTGDFDFVVINRWAKFVGRINEKIFNTYALAKSKTDVKVIVLNLNMDMQEGWRMEEGQKIKMKIE